MIIYLKAWDWPLGAWAWPKMPGPLGTGKTQALVRSSSISSNN